MAGDGAGRVGRGVELEILGRVGGLGGLRVELGHGAGGRGGSLVRRVELCELLDIRRDGI